MRPLVVAALLVGPLLGCGGCDERANAGTPDAAAPDASTPAASASARPTPSALASAGAEKASLQLLKLVFTSDVKNREPVDKLDHAEAGQRVYIHLTMRNRTGDVRPISVVFRVNGEQRSKIDLKVEPSWSFRTWAYNTLRDGDVVGELAVEVRDEAGTIVTAPLAIKGPDRAKPLRPKPERFDD